MSCFSRRIGGNHRLQVLNNVAVAATPALAGDGVAIPTYWKIGPALSSPRLFSIDFIGTPAVGARTLTGFSIYGFDGTDWWSLGALQSGAVLTIPATTGLVVSVNDVAVWQRVALAGTITGGNISAWLTPYDTFDVPNG